MLSNVNNYNLVIYTDDASAEYVRSYANNERIKIVIKREDEFFNYRYKEDWIKNHAKNTQLNHRIDWRVNMLWCEKVHFVNETMEKRYFDTDFYGWCDIGYFRCENNDLSYDLLSSWPSTEKIGALQKDKIYYALVNKNDTYVKGLCRSIMNKNEKGLPVEPISPNQISIAGGFFISHKTNIDWWRYAFDVRLQLYFENDYLVKDDQILIVDCIFSNMNRFQLCKEMDSRFNEWFVFQRLLL